MGRQQELSPGAAMLVGLLFVAAGVLPMLAAQRGVHRAAEGQGHAGQLRAEASAA